jgi:hypothetical protein
MTKKRKSVLTASDYGLPKLTSKKKPNTAKTHKNIDQLNIDRMEIAWQSFVDYIEIDDCFITQFLDEVYWLPAVGLMRDPTKLEARKFVNNKLKQFKCLSKIAKDIEDAQDKVKTDLQEIKILFPKGASAKSKNAVKEDAPRLFNSVFAESWTGRRPRKLLFDSWSDKSNLAGRTIGPFSISVASFKEIAQIVVETIAYHKDLNQAMSSFRKTLLNLNGGKYFSLDSKKLRRPCRLKTPGRGKPIYMETNLSANATRDLCLTVLSAFDLKVSTDYFDVTFR